MQVLATLALVLVALSAHAQDRTLHAMTIAGSLDNPHTQWVFNHICVPSTYLAGQGFTNEEFVQAYLIVSRDRWEKALEALARNDEKEAMKPLALISHGIIDSYWPSRVERDSAGAIVRFRECEALGNLQGMLGEERSWREPSADVSASITSTLAAVIRKWKERRPFDEVAPLLTGGPLRLNDASAKQLVLPR